MSALSRVDIEPDRSRSRQPTASSILPLVMLHQGMVILPVFALLARGECGAGRITRARAENGELLHDKPQVLVVLDHLLNVRESACLQ